MADPMDMSLDDIIKTKRPAGRGRGRGRGRGSNGSAGSGGGGGGAMRRGRGGESRSAPYSRPSGGAEQATWQHDRYQEAASTGVRGGSRGSGGGGGGGVARSTEGGNKLSISNLHFEVSDGDIKELFGEFGDLKKALVHYDSSGRSLGTADVIYARAQDAVMAMNKYSNVPLDGRAMQIEISGRGGPAPTATTSGSLSSRLGTRAEGSSSSWSAPRSGGGGGGRGRDGSGGGGQRFSGRGRGGSGGGGGGRGRGRTPRPQVSKEDLDAEMDEYHTKVEV